MRALLPEPMGEVDLLDAYALPAGDHARPFLRANMITSIDGAVNVGGRSGPLGGPADRRVFQALRSLTDVVLVGAGTARAEGYGPARLDDEARRRRLDHGMTPVPPIAVVTASGELDWSSRFFTEAEERPLVFTTTAALERVRQAAGALAEVVAAGEGQVEAAPLLGHLDAAGCRSVLLEGGPGLNAVFVQAGLVDELCLTVSPRLVGGDGPRVVAGAELSPPRQARLVAVLEEDGFLFYRFSLTDTR